MKQRLSGAGIVFDPGASMERIVGQTGDNPEREKEKQQVLFEQMSVNHDFMLSGAMRFDAWGTS
jgi:hypothetical protein